MKNKFYLWALIVSLFFQNIIVHSEPVQVKDDDGQKHEWVEAGNEKPLELNNGRPYNVGDLIHHNGELSEVVDVFKKDGVYHFALQKKDQNSRENNLINPDKDASIELLKDASFDSQKLNLNDGAPVLKPLSNEFLRKAYIEGGGPSNIDGSDMDKLQAAAFNTEKQFFDGYNNKLINESYDQINNINKELDLSHKIETLEASLPEAIAQIKDNNPPKENLNDKNNNKNDSDHDRNKNEDTDKDRDFNPDNNEENLYDSLPYTSYKKNELEAQRNRLNGLVPKDQAKYHAKVEAYNFLRSADISYNLGLPEADFLFEVSTFLVDFATDVLPVFSELKDTYRVIVGRDPITNDLLSTSDRVIAGGFLVLSFATVGGSNLIKSFKNLKIATKATSKEIAAGEKFVNNAKKIGIDSASEVAKSKPIIEHWKDSYEVTAIHSANDLNADFIAKKLEPAYVDNSKVVDFKLKEPEKFVRVHGDSNQSGRWVMAEKDIDGLSAKEIKEKFNLPIEPKQISSVELPSNTNLRTSVVGPNKFGNNNTSIQYEINETLNDSWFKDMREIK